jgi:hypothetical protein
MGVVIAMPEKYMNALVGIKRLDWMKILCGQILYQVNPAEFSLVLP